MNAENVYVIAKALDKSEQVRLVESSLSPICLKSNFILPFNRVA